jgi:hypothetical protein
MKSGEQNLRPETGSLKPEKVWSESEEWNLKLETWNRRPETGDWKSEKM